MNDSKCGHKLKVFVGFSLLRRLMILTPPLLKQFSQISARGRTLIMASARAGVIRGRLMCQLAV